ncbi:MAG TPA: WecB/TagA/CpsF family glycosyltransferase [Planctomycetaceae bacterium]|jgi:N-acetylglucosaminyldiphosphoundecaprenol N-acetyl-beta-D-mannosaminyltransferase|nr:WecB/TagA/CpsF family glycosyltransferase [Planctomycetaceae bacterium]
MTVPQPVELFGINLHPCRMSEAVDQLCGWITSDDAGRCRYVVTPNVNHAVLLQRHPQFARVYADADFVLADGVPIVLLARFFGRGVPERVAGSDLVPRLFDRARADWPLRAYLLGARPDVNERATRAVESRWPGVQVVGRDSPPFGFEEDEAENARILAQIADVHPDVLIVGLGAPKQELWVHQHRDRIRAKIALCVGATIDFLAGEKQRAPHWMRRSGLEWVHRIALEPRRLSGRYLRDGLALPGLVFRELRHSATRRRPLERPSDRRKPL